ncbi:MAG: methylated-DNA--[Oscillospiraceae bacterium]|nr:methylated-DNA--[protein]-cysteine S-methyltransferase [Oscillospiraceae bacterium]
MDLDRTALLSSPLGELLLASDGEALTGLWFAGQRCIPAWLADARRDAALPVFEQAAAWLADYFSGRLPSAPPALAPRGTAFQREVWVLLADIPYGGTRTYGELAQCLARRRGLERFSAQAVGGAVGRNPISILIPCHRVVGAGGALTGYAAGLARKRALLALEAGDPSLLFPFSE